MRTVTIIDDHQVFSELLALAVDAEPDLTCVGTAASMAAGLALVDATGPDVVVMDVRLGDADGIAATARLTAAHPRLPVVVLTAFADRSLLRRAAVAQACALVPKDVTVGEMMSVLRTARRGAYAVHPSLMRLLTAEPRIPQQRFPRLTEREQQVLQLLAAGSDARVIARELSMSVHTCRGYIESVLTKVGARSQLEAVAIAVRCGVVSPDGSGAPLSG